MSAEVLRESAALIRKRAESARTGDGELTGDAWHHDLMWMSKRYEVIATDEGSIIAESPDRWTAEHIAGFGPAVALAIADWLDTAGADIWAHGPLCECGTGCDACDDNLWEPHARAALVLARAYLGRADE